VFELNAVNHQHIVHICAYQGVQYLYAI